MMQPFTIRITILGLALLWVTGIIAAPVVYPGALSSHLYAGYGTVCHQFSAHSIHISNQPLAVCVRCTAIYAGFTLGVLLLPVFQHRLNRLIENRYYIVVLAIPMIIDVTVSWTTSYSSNLISRFSTGGIFGIGAAFLIVPLIIRAVSELFTSRHSPPLPLTPEESNEL